MSILDGFWFWIGKALAELAVWLTVATVIVIVFAIIDWRQRRKPKP